MPLLLYTYLFTEMLAPFFASLLIINSILFLGRLMQFLDSIFGLGISAADFIRLCAYLAPNLFLFSIPMASMIGVITAFTRMTNDNEMLALKAAGVGLYRMLPPLFVFALATAALTSLASTNLIPAGTVSMKKLLLQLAKEKLDKGMEEKKFSDGVSDVVLYVDKVDPVTKAWKGVYVSDMRNKDNPLTIVAEKGNLKAVIEKMYLTLNLEKGTIHRTEKEYTQTIVFDKYALTLPLKEPDSVAGESVNDIGKRGMTLRQLQTNAALLGVETPRGISLLIEFHKRLVLPAGCFVLTLIGLPLALFQFGPNRKRPGLLLALFIFLLFYIFITAGKNLSESGAFPVELAMWFPIIVFSFLTAYLTRAIASENPGFIANTLFRLGKKILLQTHGRG